MQIYYNNEQTMRQDSAMNDQSHLRKELSLMKQEYLPLGVEIVGIFGSVARGENDAYSDIDIAYKLHKDIFFQRYQDGFSQLLKLEEIKHRLEKQLHRRIDFVNITSNSALEEAASKDMLYV